MGVLLNPFVDLIYNGRNISSEIDQHTLAFDWTDNLHGKADEISVKLQDKNGLWRGPWHPQKGDTVAAAIGYREGAFIPCGEFTVDIPKAGGLRTGDFVNFKAVSAPHAKALRTQNSAEHEKKSLSQIIEKTAGRNGLSVNGNIDDVQFPYKRQRRERDLAFIKRMAEDYGHFVSIKSNQLIFYKREELEQAAPVIMLDLVDGSPIKNWSAQEQEHGTYSKAVSRYMDPDKKELIKGEATDAQVTNGDKLAIDEKVFSKGQATKLAKGRLAKANENKKTASLTLVGSPIYVAGVVVGFGPTFGAYAGNYLIYVARHSVKRADWTVKLDLKGV